MKPLPVQLANKIYAASELIAERGLDDTKIEDIAEVTGIPISTLYYHFRGKAEILAFLLNDLLAAIAAEVGVAAESQGTARERLTRVIRAQLSVMLHNPASCRALVGDLGRATRLPQLASALSAAFYQPVEQLLRDGAEDGSLIPSEDTMSEAVMIFGAVTVAGLMEAVVGSQRPMESIADGVARLLLDGLAPRTSDESKPDV